MSGIGASWGRFTFIQPSLASNFAQLIGDVFNSFNPQRVAPGRPLPAVRHSDTTPSQAVVCVA